MSRNACALHVPYGLLSARTRLQGKKSFEATRPLFSRASFAKLWSPPAFPTRGVMRSVVCDAAQRELLSNTAAHWQTFSARAWKSATFKLYLGMAGVEAMAMFDTICALDDESA